MGNTSLCEPADLTVKANLLLSFKKPKEPPTPKCSLTLMKQNAKKVADDDLLQITAGAQEGETDIIKSYTILAQTISNQEPGEDRQMIADDSAGALKNNEANLDGIMSGLTDVINNRVPKCL